MRFWHFSWSRTRNSSTVPAGVPLAPEVKPGPHQVIGTVDGTDMFFLLFYHPQAKAGPILQLRYARTMEID